MTFELTKHIKELCILSVPILAGNVGQMLIGIGDVWVAGHYSTECLAAISVASAIFMSFIIAGIGLISGITPLLANYRGEKKNTKKYFGLCILYSIMLSVIFFILLWALIPLIYKIGLYKTIVNDVVEYIKVSTFSIFGIFLFSALKEFLQSEEKVVLPNVLMIFAVFFNLVLNIILVNGYGIIPEFGTIGLAIASLITRSLLGIILLICTLKYFKNNIYRNKNFIKELIKIGTPIAGAIFIEFLGFNIVAILTGKFEEIYSACHNIIITVTSICYMIPFSLSCALSVKIGYANGEKNLADIKKYMLSALILIGIYGIMTASIYSFLNEEIMGLFTKDNKVIEQGAQIILIVACFVIFDGLQAIFTGALKGMKHVRQILLVMTLSYVFISIPAGLTLAYKYNLILKGFWMGLSLAIVTAAIISSILYIRNYYKLKKQINI